MNGIITGIYGKFVAVLKNPNIRIALYSILSIIVVSTILISLNIEDKSYNYNVADISTTDIRVPRDVHFVNIIETEKKKKRISKAVPIVFDKDAVVLKEKLHMISTLMRHVETAKYITVPFGIDAERYRFNHLKTILPNYLKYRNSILKALLSYKSTSRLKRAFNKILISIYDNNRMGFLEKVYSNPLKIKNKNITIRTINSSDIINEISSNINELKIKKTLQKNTRKICKSVAPYLPTSTSRAVSFIVRNSLQSNLKFNEVETQRRIDLQVSLVKPITGILKQGQMIIREGDAVTPDVMVNLEIINKNVRTSNLSYIFGVLLIQLVFLLIFSYFIIEYKGMLIPDKKSSIVILSLVLVFMIFSFFVAQNDSIINSKLNFPFILPLAFVTMLLSILYNPHIALLVGSHLVFFTVLLSGGSLTVGLIAFSSGILGVFINSNVIERTDFLKGGFYLGFINSIVVFALGLLTELPWSDIFTGMQLSIANGIANSILVFGILPLYENVFGITTKFKLLELSDLNADIFKDMLLRAPGTYNHSLLVSTLAENACKDIGANHLLARVGAFYHDIGKIVDSNMYIENTVTDPRAKVVSSQKYAGLIISHIEKGVALAQKNRLPESVIDFIREHHGKTTLAYFYYQALEKADAVGRCCGSCFKISS